MILCNHDCNIIYTHLSSFKNNLNLSSMDLLLSYASVPLGFSSVADAFTMESDKHQAMFGRYN